MGSNPLGIPRTFKRLESVVEIFVALVALGVNMFIWLLVLIFHNSHPRYVTKPVLVSVGLIALPLAPLAVIAELNAGGPPVTPLTGFTVTLALSCLTIGFGFFESKFADRWLPSKLRRIDPNP